MAEIKYRIDKIEALGMECPLVRKSLIDKVSIEELNRQWIIEKQIIQGAINDISLYL